MTSFELVVSLPASWDNDHVTDLAVAVEEAIDRFPGASVQVRITSPGLLAEVDQLQAQVQETSARIDRAEANLRRVQGSWRSIGLWAAGFGTGCGLGIAAFRFLM